MMLIETTGHDQESALPSVGGLGPRLGIRTRSISRRQLSGSRIGLRALCDEWLYSSVLCTGAEYELVLRRSSLAARKQVLSSELKQWPAEMRMLFKRFLVLDAAVSVINLVHCYMLITGNE